MDDDVRLTTGKDADILRRMRKELAMLRKQPQPKPRMQPKRSWSFKNTESEEVPALACFYATDAAKLDERVYCEIEKPSTTYRRTILVNEAVAVPRGEYGRLQDAEYLRVKYDTGTPVAGETWGPKPGQWTLSKDYPGFVCLGVLDSSNKIMLVRRSYEFRGFAFTLHDGFDAHAPLYDRALATVDQWWGVEPQHDVDTYTYVFDPLHLFRRAKAGAKGLAIWDDHHPTDATAENPGGWYRVIECQSKAGWVRFQLTAALRSGSATATRLAVAGSQQDVQEPVGTLIVYDEDNLFAGATTGDRGWAFYDASEDKYHVVECSSQAGWVIATIGTDGDLSAATVNDFGGTQQDTTTPDTVALEDPLGLVSDSGDAGFSYPIDAQQVFAIYDSVGDRYVIVSRKSGTQFLARVSLTANMSGGSATATFSVAGPTTVHDTQSLFRRALSGAAGLAAWDDVGKKWELVECQSQAGWIVATTNLSLGSVSVIDYGGTQQDVQSPGTPTLNDPMNLLGTAGPLTSSDSITVFAVLDADSGEYNIVSVKQVNGFIVHVTLTANMSGGSASATLIGGMVPITVKDTAGLFVDALSGAKGIAIRKGADWELLECQSKAGFVCGTLDADWPSHPTDATLNVTYYGGTQQDVQDPGATVSVRAHGGPFYEAKSGAYCVAIWSEVERVYIAVSCVMPCTVCLGTLSADIGPTDETASVSNVGGWVQGWNRSEPDTFSTASNLFKLAGLSGDRVRLEWNGSSWVITQVAHHVVNVDVSQRVNGVELQQKRQRIATMVYEDEQDWVMWHTGTNCP